jgi:hypothetical protein
VVATWGEESAGCRKDGVKMAKLLEEIKYDLGYLKLHTLQPQWFKVVKVIVLLGFLIGYIYLFGWITTVIFFAVFFALSTVVHLVYRSKTNRWTQSWLDFVVVELVVSQVLP